MKPESVSSIGKVIERRIRFMAKRRGLIAQKSRQLGLWFFADQSRLLKSPPDGLDTKKAYKWLANNIKGKGKL
jgi:hypothetical protein